METRYPDSLGKILPRYFAAITKVAYEYNGEIIKPFPLIVSSRIADGYICEERCGACCLKFTLDYIEGELMPDDVVERKVEFNGRMFTVWTDYQKENKTDYCKHLSMEDAKCLIYDERPFTCDFELLRVYKGPKATTCKLRVGKFARPFYMKQPLTGAIGPLCKIVPATKESAEDSIRKLEKLQQWATYFGLTETWVPEIINYIKTGGYRYKDKIATFVDTGTFTMEQNVVKSLVI